jgi:competence protein ComEA
MTHRTMFSATRWALLLAGAALLAGSASASAQAAQPAKPAQTAKPAAKPKTLDQPIKPNRVFIDINHATAKELKQIPGIGDAYAKKIIDGRPYANKTQLVSKKILSQELYETIQGMIIAKQ